MLAVWLARAAFDEILAQAVPSSLLTSAATRTALRGRPRSEPRTCACSGIPTTTRPATASSGARCSSACAGRCCALRARVDPQHRRHHAVRARTARAPPEGWQGRARDADRARRIRSPERTSSRSIRSATPDARSRRTRQLLACSVFSSTVKARPTENPPVRFRDVTVTYDEEGGPPRPRSRCSRTTRDRSSRTTTRRTCTSTGARTRIADARHACAYCLRAPPRFSCRWNARDRSPMFDAATDLRDPFRRTSRTVRARRRPRSLVDAEAGISSFRSLNGPS